MQEETSLEQNAKVYEDMAAAENDDSTTPNETIEYIDVHEQETYVVEVDEAFASTENGETSNHALLTNRDLPGQHPIGAIDGLQGVLDNIQSLKSGLYAGSGGLAEFREWADGNPTWENRSGYFVSVINGDGEIDICDKQVSDVYGVVVPSGAFCGYQDEVNKSGNPLYAMVCLVGNVKVRIREDSDIVAGDYVIADNYGYAIKSENDVGFRVLSIGTDPIIEHYASIALVPQNDNVSRVMEQLSTTNGELSNVIVQLGKVEDALIEVEKNSNTAIEVAGDVKDILNEAVGSMGVKLENVTDIANQAKDSAERIMNDANAIYTDAVSTANSAKESANSALGGIQELQTSLEPLAEWSEGDNKGIAGFVAQANEDRTQLSTLVTAMYGDGVDVVGVMQQIDKNGASIQNLVVHADKYSVGPHSLSYGLTYDEAMGLLQTEHVYVATETHTETSDLYICNEHNTIYEGEECHFIVGNVTYKFTAPTRIDSNVNIYCNIGRKELSIDGNDEVYPVIMSPTSINLIDSEEMLQSQRFDFPVETGKTYTFSCKFTKTAEEINGEVYICIWRAMTNGEPVLGQTSWYLVENGVINGEFITFTVTEGEQWFIDISGNISSNETFSDYFEWVKLEGPPTNIELTFNSEYTYSFSRGKSYKWIEDVDNPGVCIWAYDSIVYFNPPENAQENNLWFCLNGVTENDKLIYHPETLYHYDGTQWVSVATIDGNLQARALGLVKQTANELTSTYTNLRGDMSTIKQTVNEVSTTVANVEGEISSINQAADSIIAGTYNSEGSSSLSMLLDYSFTAVSEGRYHRRTNSFAGTGTVVGYRYTQPPSWNEAENKFVFNESHIDSEGKYYFNSDDHTTYCKDVKDGYEVYTIGNTAISALDSRVSETESAMDSWTRFKTGTNETMSVISQTSNEDGADIASVVYGNYRQCVEIKTELTDEEKNDIPLNRYDKAPDYANSAFTFKGTETATGKYYMLDEDNECYYKVINPDGEIIGYEKYIMKTSNYASIMQKVDENGSVIGLVVSNNDVEGGIFVTAINNSTTALISADKIGINGTAIFTDNVGDGSTTISGNYIRSGALESNNYKPPIETTKPFAEVGTKFDLELGTITSKNFNLDADGSINMNGNIIMSGSIVLNGSISWGANNSPVLVLYAQSNLSKPPNIGDILWKKYDEYEESSADTWHRVCGDADSYASYSYDGGNTWTAVIQIKGIKGDRGPTGPQGSSAEVPDYIQDTYIDFNRVEAPVIYGGIFKTHSEGTAYATMGNNEFAIYDVNSVTPKVSLGYNTAAYNETNQTGGEISLCLGAGYTWSNGTTVDKFEITKVQGGAEIRYTDDDNTTTSIKFTDSGIVIDGLTGVTAVFG